MNVRKVLAFSAAALLLPLAAPALAQSALRVGATVTDPQGGTVGTITAINGANLTLHTDRHDVPAAGHLLHRHRQHGAVRHDPGRTSTPRSSRPQARGGAGVPGRRGAARQYRRRGRAGHGARRRDGHRPDRRQRPPGAARRAPAQPDGGLVINATRAQLLAASVPRGRAAGAPGSSCGRGAPPGRHVAQERLPSSARSPLWRDGPK